MSWKKRSDVDVKSVGGGGGQWRLVDRGRNRDQSNLKQESMPNPHTEAKVTIQLL